MTARTGAAAMGLGVGEIVEAVMALSAKDFYKSMTTHADHTIWQDRIPPCNQGRKYLFEIDCH